MKMFRCLLGIASLFFTPAVRAETLPNDLQPVTLEQAVAISDLGVSTFSMAHYGTWPPLPFGAEFVGNYPLYVSQSTAGLFYDDREAVATQMLLSAAEELLPPPDGDTNSVPGDTNYVYSAPIPPWTTNFTNLLVEIRSASANAGMVEYRIGVPSTDVTGTFTNTNGQIGDNYGMVMVSFKPAN